MKYKYIPVLLAMMLSACHISSSGDDTSTNSDNTGSGTTNSTTTFPFASAVSAFMQASHNYNLSGVSGADTYTMQVSFTPGAQQTFEGHLSSTSVMSKIIEKNGVVVGTSSVTEYFDVSPYTSWGTTSNGSYNVVAEQQPLPTSATVGHSGAVDTITAYTDSTKFSVSAKTTETWSLESDTSTTAWACINSTIIYTNDSSTTTGAKCFKSDQSGNVSAMKFVVYINGINLTFK